MKAIGFYGRISDDETGQAAGVARQEKDCRDFAKKHGLTISKKYADNSISAWSGKTRPAYQQMLADVRAGVIDGVIAWHVDRLYRTNRELEEFLDLVKEAGIEDHVYTVFGDYKLSNSDHRAMLRVAVTFANKESDDKSRRILRKKQELAEQGKPNGGPRPFGYEADLITVRESEGELIREAARRVLSGEGTMSIVRDWTKRGVKTTTGKDWRAGTLRQMLLNPRYAGLRSMGSRQDWRSIARDENGEAVKAVWEPIITVDEWEKLGTLFTDPRRMEGQRFERNRRYLLTGGLLICGRCGSPQAARARKRNTDGRNVRAYGCSQQGCYCGQEAEVLEEFIREAVFDHILSPAFERAMKESSGDKHDDRRLLALLREDERALEELTQDRYVSRIIDHQSFLMAKAALDKRLIATRRKLAAFTATEVVASAPTGEIELRKAWETKGLDWQRQLVSSVLEAVVLNPAKGKGARWTPDRLELKWRDGSEEAPKKATQAA